MLRSSSPTRRLPFTARPSSSTATTTCPGSSARRRTCRSASSTSRKPQKELHTDIPRLRKGGVGAQFWSAYVAGRARARRAPPSRETLEQIDVVHRMVERYPDDFEMAYTADDIAAHPQGGQDRLADRRRGRPLDRQLARRAARCYYALGVALHDADPHRDARLGRLATDEPKSNGLTPFGEEVVREMNRLGMLVDISHVSADDDEARAARDRRPR